MLFMIPLRRQLIVKEHGNLTFPEGTACADVLVAGERGGSFAGRVFWGLGLGGVYTFCMNTMQMWPGQPEYRPKWLPGASFRAAVTSEYLGVGYIIGPKVAGTIFAGGVFSWLVLMPAIRFFGSLAPGMALYPSTIPIPQMTPDQLWASYIRPMGAGAVAAAGLITLVRTLPTIVSALSAGMKDVRAKQRNADGDQPDRARPVDAKWCSIGSLVIVAMMWALLTFKPIPGAQTGVLSNLMAAVFVVVFGFLFVTVSSRICGLIGNSSNPVSGMTIATLMATCAMFLVAGWTAGSVRGAGADDWRRGLHRCGQCRRHFAGFEDRLPGWRDAGVAADRVDDRRDGFVVRRGRHADPDEQGPGEVHAGANSDFDSATCRRACSRKAAIIAYKGKDYMLVNALGSHVVPDGKYLYDPATGAN